jgi:hypothetical protein
MATRVADDDAVSVMSARSMRSVKSSTSVSEAVARGKPAARPRTSRKKEGPVLTPEERLWAKAEAQDLIETMWSFRQNDIKTIMVGMGLDPASVKTKGQGIERIIEVWMQKEEDVAESSDDNIVVPTAAASVLPPVAESSGTSSSSSDEEV